jgi:hypothetical protein
MRKFSEKTASTRRQMPSKKGADKRPFPKFDKRRIRGKFYRSN